MVTVRMPGVYCCSWVLLHLFPNEGLNEHFSQCLLIARSSWLCHVSQAIAISADGASDGGAAPSFIPRYVNVVLNLIATVRISGFALGRALAEAGMKLMLADSRGT
jgi:hypothetical protein